jgi:hypothetical protein
MRRPGPASLCLFAAAVSVALAPGTPGDVDTPDYRYVGRIRSASGVMVGPDLVLTAKHVGVDQVYLPGFGYFAPVGEAVAHPDSDLLLYRIDPRGFTLPFVSVLADPVPTGATVMLLGYGVSGVLNGDGTGYDLSLPRGMRRKAPAIVDRTEFMTFQGFQPGYSLITALRQNGQGALANGDSGGGVFETIYDTIYLVGIHSFAAVWGNGAPYGFSASSTDYFAGGSVSLSHYAAWLRDNGASVVRRKRLGAAHPVHLLAHPSDAS